MFNEMNKQLLTEDLNLIKTKSVISAFMSKLLLFKRRFAMGELYQFQNLIEVKKEGQVSDADVEVYREHLQALHNDFASRFEDILYVAIPDWVINSFASIEDEEISLQLELLDLQSNAELKPRLAEEWVIIDSDHEDDAAERESNVGTSVSDAPKSEESERPHELQATSEDSEQVKQVRRQPMRRCVKRAKEKEHEVNFTALADPGSVSEALSSPDSANWRRAMDEEYESLLKRQTWIEVDIPEKASYIGSKWVFRRKLDSTGSVER
ncbi:hypothetical protein M514_27889 [Trichuris suis]|uniref:Reverse transcriptase Ty1/copia-type domain-containing protein n=1 Tax=Trichuris suis TaxID=68888 RepID=A0A085MRU3_9BILA|nr:hypothetical protein M514_27889 [Trichuris suis]